MLLYSSTSSSKISMYFLVEFAEKYLNLFVQFFCELISPFYGGLFMGDYMETFRVLFRGFFKTESKVCLGINYTVFIRYFRRRAGRQSRCCFIDFCQF